MTEVKLLSDEPVRPLDHLLNIFATGLGIGFFPYAPGTAGSLLGPLLVWSLGVDGRFPWLMLLYGVIAFLVGIPICNAGIRAMRVKDPKQVVFDEIAAFFWVFALVPLTPMTVVGGFLLFRLFDILKPWPIRRFEALPQGLGVMADDAIAGMLAGGLLVLGMKLSSAAFSGSP